MAHFCPYCGNPVDEEAKFCDSCGNRVEDSPASEPTQPEQPAYQPPQQSYRPAQPDYQPQQAYQPQPAYQTKQGKKHTGLIVGLIVGGVALIAIALVVIFVFLNPLSKLAGVIPAGTSAVTEAQPETSAPTEAPTEASTEPPTEPPTEAPTEAPAKLPYEDSLGEVKASDFAWIADAMSGDLSGSFLGVDDLVGRWKGEIIYDGVWELVYVTIDRDAKITIEPYQINYGEGWENEAGEDPYVFNGAFDISSVNGAGSYGSINLYTFLESGGTQYCVGTFSVNNSSSADVYMVRP